MCAIILDGSLKTEKHRLCASISEPEERVMRSMQTKRKENNEGTIYIRSDGRWEGKVTTPYGRRSVYGLSREEVRKKLSEIRTDVDRGEYIDETDMTVEEWMSEWQSLYLDVKPGTLRKYEGDIRNHIIPSLGRIKLAELTVADVETSYIQWKKEGLSAKSVRNIHGVLHKALDKAVSKGMIRKNVSDECDIPKGHQGEMRPLEDEEVPEFLRVAEEDTLLYPLYYMALFTGMRQSELIGLTWDCVNLATGKIRIYRQLLRVNVYQQKGEYRFVETKTGKQRTIEPPQQVIKMLEKVKGRQQIWKKNCGEAWRDKDKLVFTNSDGSHLSTSNVSRHFKRIVTSMGLGEVRFHDLRHTYAVISIENGVDMKTLSISMGHHSVAFTMDKYGHVSGTMRKKAAEKMSEYITEITTSKK